MGRDGKMTKIDLWQNPENMLVAEVTIAYDVRDVAVSGDGKYVIGGAYWPPHFAIVDAETMEPKKVVSTRGVNVDGDYVEEARVAAICTAICEEAEERYVELLGKPSAEEDGVTVVKMYKYRFCPVNITVPVGTTVRWVNVDKRTSHSVIVDGEPDSDRAFPEEILEYTFLVASAEGDAKKGKRIFNKCKACHAVGEGAKNKIGRF